MAAGSRQCQRQERPSRRSAEPAASLTDGGKGRAVPESEGRDEKEQTARQQVMVWGGCPPGSHAKRLARARQRAAHSRPPTVCCVLLPIPALMLSPTLDHTVWECFAWGVEPERRPIGILPGLHSQHQPERTTQAACRRGDPVGYRPGGARGTRRPRREPLVEAPTGAYVLRRRVRILSMARQDLTGPGRARLAPIER